MCLSPRMLYVPSTYCFDAEPNYFCLQAQCQGHWASHRVGAIGAYIKRPPLRSFMAVMRTLMCTSVPDSFCGCSNVHTWPRTTCVNAQQGDGSVITHNIMLQVRRFVTRNPDGSITHHISDGRACEGRTNWERKPVRRQHVTLSKALHWNMQPRQN